MHEKVSCQASWQLQHQWGRWRQQQVLDCLSRYIGPQNNQSGRSIVHIWFSFMSSWQITNEAGCLTPCLKREYPHVQHPPFDVEASNFGGGDFNLVIFMFAAKETILTRTEYLTYDLTSLAADIGGLAGMLLGTSLLSCYEYLERLAGKWNQKISTWKQPFPITMQILFVTEINNSHCFDGNCFTHLRLDRKHKWLWNAQASPSTPHYIIGMRALWIVEKVLIVGLIIAFVVSLLDSWSKFRKGRIATEITDKLVSDFQYPAFDFCAYIKVSKDSNYTMVKMANHTFYTDSREKWG